MQLRQWYGRRWLVLAVAALLLAQLAATQLTWAHDERGHGRDGERKWDTSLVFEHGDDHHGHREGRDDEHFEDRADDEALANLAPEDMAGFRDLNEDEARGSLADAPPSAPPAEAMPAEPEPGPEL